MKQLLGYSRMFPIKIHQRVDADSRRQMSPQDFLKFPRPHFCLNSENKSILRIND